MVPMSNQCRRSVVWNERRRAMIGWNRGNRCRLGVRSLGADVQGLFGGLRLDVVFPVARRGWEVTGWLAVASISAGVAGRGGCVKVVRGWL